MRQKFLQALFLMAKILVPFILGFSLCLFFIQLSSKKEGESVFSATPLILQAKKLINADSPPPPELPKPPSKKTYPVETGWIEGRDMRESFISYANLKPAREIKLRPKSGITVGKVYVKTGETVRKGQKLARLLSAVQDLKLQLASMEMQIKQTDFEITKRLAEKDFVAKNVLAKKKMDLKIQKLRQKINKIQSNHSILRSPIDGIVSKVDFRKGDYVDDSNKYQMKIVSYNEFRIDLFLPQSISSKVDLDETKVLIWSEGDEETPTETKISEMSPIVDPKSGTIETKIFIEEPPEYWRPGMYVRIEIILEERTGVPSVPNDSIVYRGDQRLVFSVDRLEENPKAMRNKPTFGLTDGHYTEVLDGLDPSAEIVIKGQGLLKHKSLISLPDE